MPGSQNVHAQDRVTPSGMRMGGMRWVDHWVGLPMCFLFGMLATAARAILPKRPQRISGERTLVVLKFFGLGSITEATPLLRALRQRYPNSRLAFVTFDTNEALVGGLGLCTDLRVIRTQSPFAFALDVLAQIAWLRRHRAEAVIDLEFFSKFSTLLSFLTGARVRVGFHLNDFWRRSLVTHPIYFNYYRHLTDVYEQAARQLDAEITDHALSGIEPGDEARQSVRQTIESQGWQPGPLLLGVNVNAGELSLERRWTLEGFAAVIDALLARREQLRVCLTGGPDEKAYVSSLVDLLPSTVRSRVMVVAGRWSLKEFVAALDVFDGFVTNDSGPMHLAAAAGLPMVAIFGPSRPDFYAPRTDRIRVIYEAYPCSPCVGMFTTFEGMWCRHEGWCMQAIEPAMVLEAVEAMLSGADRRRSDRAAATSMSPKQEDP